MVFCIDFYYRIGSDGGNMMEDLNCPSCGTTQANISPGFCECCGFEFTKEFIDEFKAVSLEKEKQIQLKIEKEKERQKKEAEELERKIAIEKQKELEEKKYQQKLERQKKIIGIWLDIEDNVGIVLSVIFAIIIAGQTIRMASTTGITGGWIFFIILSIASVFASGFAYLWFNEELTKDFTHIIPSGIIGSLVISTTICYCWDDMIVGTFREGFLVVLFTGIIVVIVFLLSVAIVSAITIAIAFFLPAFIQTKIDALKGGLIGTVITAIAASLYLLIDTEALSFVLGYPI